VYVGKFVEEAKAADLVTTAIKGAQAHGQLHGGDHKLAVVHMSRFVRSGDPKHSNGAGLNTPITQR
jgi:hypothetical protein